MLGDHAAANLPGHHAAAALLGHHALLRVRLLLLILLCRRLLLLLLLLLVLLLLQLPGNRHRHLGGSRNHLPLHTEPPPPGP